MASGTLAGAAGDGSRDKQRWSESKVYTRKSFNKSAKPSLNITSQSLPSAVAENVISSQQPISQSGVASDDSSSLNRRPDSLSGNGFLHNLVKVDISSRSKQEIRDLRKKLTDELEQVRSLVKRLETRELQIKSGYSHSQVSANDVPKQRGNTEAVVPAPPRNPHRQLTVSVIENGSSDLAGKEKRTPKANQYYRNSDFVLGKEKFPPPESNKKFKPNGANPGMGDKHMALAFKHCLNILTKLIKHKFGWVFNKPVDVQGLGLYDYYTIIKHPMDLGTVKSRLDTNWYKSPREFAEDVRLTFSNAMTYNPKGQDVHTMADQLSKVFEEQWKVVQPEYIVHKKSELDHEVGPPAYLMKKAQAKAQAQAVLPDMRRTLNWLDSTTVPVDPKPQTVSYTPTGRVAAPKKPKAKDPHKRDMTYEEKQKLSANLVNLPSEKLDNIVQIIKKRNAALSQHDDEIEVDIDSFDAETLWELDRFVTNYKKSLSKNKRRAELASQVRGGPERSNYLELQPLPAPVEAQMDIKTDKKIVSSSSPALEENHGGNRSRSSSSSSSSSDSGSSSSDSDSGSSSAGHSSRT